ncbi:hypothetical protein RJ640_024073 [Escallonia rubra]|uniref:Glycosyltransferase N-terminal domain-containing protein n=1 Tax=Escallonia rubra TaxID=112253 RepID=A0AA88RVP5_9ASTE|nr:hypothetical protein RJ640_024073 [Escallonia rubra]
MASHAKQLHFVLFPLMAQGHMIPMIDIARLLAQRGVVVTIITTPLNAKRFEPVMARATQGGLQIQLVQLHFRCVEAGLPEGCENIDMLPSLDQATKFFAATGMLKEPVEQLLQELKPSPSCMISDMCFPWTTDLACKFHIPRLVFHGICCFALLCSHNLLASRVFDKVESESERFVVPGLPDRIELTKPRLPSIVYSKSAPASVEEFRNKITEAGDAAYGVVVNSFEELEPEYLKGYAEAKKGNKIWCIGPVSLCNQSNLDKAERGNKASIDEKQCLEWLDSWEPSSVVYVCLGSLSRLATSQLIELGLGLEASNRPFIWCIRYQSEEFERWILEEGYEERTRGRCLLIRGWSPQVLILSHRAVGGFLTHCGWNSTLEGVSAGVPLMTWPMFAEQFCNEELVVQVLKIGVRSGVEVPVVFGEEEKIGVLVYKNDVKMALDRLMDEGEEGEERRKRARKLGEMAKRAIEEGGSSHLNLTMLIQDILEQANGLLHFAMASQAKQLHFVLFPLMAQGHMIPMIDIARLLAQRGVVVTIITTPLNANRFEPVIARATQAGLRIQLVLLHFPCVEAGLPEGCENFDMLPSLNLATKFIVAIGMLKEPVEQLLHELKPSPSCMISDMCFPWTTDLACKLHIPRLVFHGTCCFALLCSHNLLASRVFDKVESESERFVVPGLPDRIELTKPRLPSMVYSKSAPASGEEFHNKVREAGDAAYGIVVNSFEELEPEYINGYTEAKKGNKIWCIGPVSLCNQSNLDKAERGSKASIDEKQCLEWLDSWEPSSVVYVCLGSLSRLATSQLIELGLGLEASNRPFIWCIRYQSEEFERWILEEGYEERTRGRCLLIRGWAPQVLILSHRAVGGFLTHCGWNSTLEGVSAGVPLMTWPTFAEQFCNEELVVQVLKIGVRSGVEVPIVFGEEEKIGVLVYKSDVKMALDRLMDEGEEGEERRKRARKLGEMAKHAIEEGGSSHLNLTTLIQDILEQAN